MLQDLSPVSNWAKAVHKVQIGEPLSRTCSVLCPWWLLGPRDGYRDNIQAKTPMILDDTDLESPSPEELIPG